MKTSRNFNANLVNDIFSQFILTNEEMICVRGGEGEPIVLPGQPPVKI